MTKINNDQYRVSRAKTWGASRNGKTKAPRVVYQGKPEMARAKKFSSSFVVFLFLRPVFRLASAICWLLSRQLATATPSASPATRSDGHAIRGTPSSILDGRRRRGTQTPNKDHSVRPSVRPLRRSMQNEGGRGPKIEASGPVRQGAAGKPRPDGDERPSCRVHLDRPFGSGSKQRSKKTGTPRRMSKTRSRRG